MQALQQKIESLLFVEPKPFSISKIAKLCEATEEEVMESVNALHEQYINRNGGLMLVMEGDTIQMTTAAAQAEFIGSYLKDEQTGELTRPSLETLTIIAYRGPVSKAEIELIRGVNCSLILRNLQIRGLVDEVDITESGSPVYRVTVDLLKTLGISSTKELPDFEQLNENVHLQEMLEQQDPSDFFGKAPQAENTDAAE